MNDLFCIGSSICSRIAKNWNVDFFKFSRMNKKAVQEVNQLKNKIKRRKNILIFLNTNSLVSTKKVKKYGGKAHIHKAKRLTRIDRLESYFRHYESLIEILSDRKIFIVCNMGRCFSPRCDCREAASFSIVEQLKLFRNIEKGIRKILEKTGKSAEFMTHQKLMKNLGRTILDKKRKSLRCSDVRTIYQFILGDDDIHPNNEGLRLLSDVLSDWVQRGTSTNGNRFCNRNRPLGNDL